jgi:hypothetical protein
MPTLSKLDGPAGLVGRSQDVPTLPFGQWARNQRLGRDDPDEVANAGSQKIADSQRYIRTAKRDRIVAQD